MRIFQLLHWFRLLRRKESARLKELNGKSMTYSVHSYIPDRGGVSTDAREGLKADISELVESAVVATVSHIPESKKVFTVADVNAMFKESMKEVLPEIVEAIQSGNKSTSYCSYVPDKVA